MGKKARIGLGQFFVGCSLLLLAGGVQADPSLSELLDSAREAEALGDLAAATEKYGAIQEQAKAQQSELERAQALYGLASVAKLKGENVGAVEGFNEALELFKEEQASAWIGVVNYQLAEVYRIQGDAALALATLEAATKAFEAVESDDTIRRWRAEVLVARGHLTSDPKVAAGLFDDASDLWKAVGAPVDMGDALYERGLRERERGDLRHAARSLEAAITRYREGSALEWAAASQLALAQVRQEQGDWEGARNRYRNALRDFELMVGERSAFEIVAAAGLAEAELELGEAAKALELFEKVSTLAESLDPAWQRTGQFGKARALEALGRGEEAVLEFAALLEGLPEAGSDHMRVSAVLAIGAKERDPEQALKHFDEALPIAEKLADRGAMIRAHRGRANALTLLGRADEAQNSLKILYAVLPEGEHKARAEVGMALAKLYGASGDFEKADDIYDEIASDTKREAPIRFIEIQRQWAALYIGRDDLRNAKACLGDAIKVAEKEDQTQLLAGVQLDYSRLMLLMGSSFNAIKAAEEAQDAFKAVKDQEGEGRALVALARAQVRSWKRQQARRTLKQLKELATGNAELELAHGILLARLELRQGKNANAEAALKALETLDAQPFTELKAELDLVRAKMALILEEPAQARTLVEPLIKVFEASGEPILLADALAILGEVLLKSEPEIALKYLERAEDLFDDYSLRPEKKAVRRLKRGLQ